MTALLGGETIAAGRWLYGKLAAVPGSNGTFPGAAERGSIAPYIIYQSFPRPGGGDTNALGDVRVLARLRFLVKVVSATLSEAEPVVRAIDLALKGDPDVPPEQVSGYSILNVRRVEPYEIPSLEGDELFWESGGYYDIDVTAGV
jgi:hypothetical protein